MSARWTRFAHMSETVVSDHELLAAGVRDLVEENAAHARRLDRLLQFHSRCERRSGDDRFELTPVQETVVEVGELWGLSPGRVRSSALAVGCAGMSFAAFSSSKCRRS